MKKSCKSKAVGFFHKALVISSNLSPKNKIMSREKNKISQEGKKADKKMSKRKSETNEEKIKARRPKKEKSVNKAKPEIINKIIEKIKTLVKKSEDWEDENDSIGNKIKEIFRYVLEKFEELIAENKNKKSFIGGLINIFTILLTAKCSRLAN